MASSKSSPPPRRGGVHEEVVRVGQRDPRVASERPALSEAVDLDAALMEFLLSEPPPLELGSIPPDFVLESIPPESRARFAPPPVPLEADPRVDRVSAPGIGLPPTVGAAPPPPPKRTPEMRAKRLVKQLETVGPGDEAPVVQALLGIGAPALPLVAEAFPGLLWFNRALPHVAVPRGRDVSPVARTLVAFGEGAHETVRALLRSPNADHRFYALLVAQDLGAAAFVDELVAGVLDPDGGARTVATATLLGLPAEVRAPARERLLTALRDDTTNRDARLHAIRALTRLRVPEAVPLLVDTLGPFDPELEETCVRALSALTGHGYGADPARWRAFWAKHGERPRVEWLLDAIEVTDPGLLEFTVHELAEISGETVDEPDLPNARKRIAKVYRRWWKQHAPERSVLGRFFKK